MSHTFSKKQCQEGLKQMQKVLEDERTPQKVCCTYCSLEPGMAYHKEITVLEGVQDRPFRTVPTGWSE